MCMHVQVSRLHLVDMPGAEQLLVDPELLRQTEGSQVNQSLLSFATTLRKLAQGKKAHTINHDGSVLTKLLSGILLALVPVMPDWKSPQPCRQEVWQETQLKAHFSSSTHSRLVASRLVTCQHMACPLELPHASCRLTQLLTCIWTLHIVSSSDLS